jgi:hypothetical protein
MFIFPAVLLRKIGYEVRLLAAEIVGYCSTFRAAFESAVAAEVEKAQSLDNLSASDYQRIQPVLDDAARCYHSVRLWPIFKTAIKYRPRMKIVIAVAAMLIAAYTIYVIPSPAWSSLSGPSIMLSIVAVELIVVVAALVHSRMPDSYVAILLLIEVAACVLVIMLYKKWSPYPQPVWRHLVFAAPLLHQHDRVDLASTSIVPAVQLTSWLIIIICIIDFSRRYIRTMAKWTKSPLEIGYRRSAQQSAELIIAMVHVSHFVDELIKTIQTDPDESQLDENQQAVCSSNVLAWNQYLTNRERSELNSMLANLAYTVKRRWTPAMASSHGIAGQWTANYGSQIEFFIRRQQVRNMLVGNNLLELRQVMTVAMAQAADGDWHLIGAAGECPNIRIVARWKRALRRMLSISAPLVAAAVADHFLRGIPAGYLHTIILTLIAFSGIQLIYVLDPDSPARLDIAGRVTGLFKHS